MLILRFSSSIWRRSKIEKACIESFILVLLKEIKFLLQTILEIVREKLKSNHKKTPTMIRKTIHVENSTSQEEISIPFLFYEGNLHYIHYNTANIKIQYFFLNHKKCKTSLSL